MRIYLWEFGYPQRLKELAKDVATAVPNVAGKTNRWARAVAEARNGFAHSFAASPAEGQIIRYHILQNSLRWLLVGRILLELGVPAEDLSAKFLDFEPYRRFIESARRDLPDIYY